MLGPCGFRGSAYLTAGFQCHLDPLGHKQIALCTIMARLGEKYPVAVILVLPLVMLYVVPP